MKKTRIKNIVGGCLLAVVVIGVAPLLYAPVLGDLASMYAPRTFSLPPCWGPRCCLSRSFPSLGVTTEATPPVACFP